MGRPQREQPYSNSGLLRHWKFAINSEVEQHYISLHCAAHGRNPIAITAVLVSAARRFPMQSQTLIASRVPAAFYLTFAAIIPLLMLHAALLEHLKQRFTGFFSSPIFIHQYEAVYGGDINRCFVLETNKGKFFIKVNASIFGLDMFEKEAMGLMLLADAGAIKVPGPLFNGKFNQQIFLVIEYIQPGQAAKDFWKDFGESLSELHRNSGDMFGLNYNNYIGKLVQSNDQRRSWAEFYATERILPLTQKAHEKGMLETKHLNVAEHICNNLHNIFPEEKPALLHGDLWNGNFIVGADGRAAIFDPAVYFGNREMDLSMSLLFGGFDRAFYEAYEHHFPLQAGWRGRVPLCQLYPLLVHLLLFGGSYREKVVETLAQYK